MLSSNIAMGYQLMLIYDSKTLLVTIARLPS